MQNAEFQKIEEEDLQRKRTQISEETAKLDREEEELVQRRQRALDQQNQIRKEEYVQSRKERDDGGDKG